MNTRHTAFIIILLLPFFFSACGNKDHLASYIESINSNKIDSTFQLDLLNSTEINNIYALGLPLKVDENSISKQSKQLAKIKSSILNYQFSEAVSELKIIDRTNLNLVSKNIYEEFNLACYGQLNSTEVNRILTQDLEAYSSIDLYSYIRLLTVVQEHFIDDYNFNASIATAFYILYLIETSEYPFIYNSLKSEVLISLSIQLVNEGDSYNNLLQQVKEELIKTLQIENKYDKINYVKSYIFEDSTIVFDNIENLDLSIVEKQSVLLSYALRASYSNDKKAIEIYDIGLTLSQKEMTVFDILLDIYKTYSLINLNKVDQVNKNIETLKKSVNQLSFKREKVSFGLAKMIHFNNKSNNECSQSLASIIKERNEAIQSFKGNKSFHLEDYYSQNTIDFLNLLIECKMDLSNKKSEIINSFYNAKKQTKKNIQGISYNNPAFTKSLLKVNEFKNLSNLKDPIYKSLFFASMNEYTVDTVKKEENIDLISIEKYTNHNIVNFITYSKRYGNTLSSYGYYSSSKNLFQADVLDKLKIDTLIHVFLEKLRTNKSYEIERKHLRKAFNFIGELNENEPIYLLPDGKLNFLPFELIFPKKKFVYLNTIDDLDTPMEILKKTNGKILSFSDPQTLSSTNKLLIPELKNAYEETFAIKEITKGQYIKGLELNRKSFFDSFNSDYIHIATHGKADAFNRLNNYLIVRNQERLDTIYSFEILQEKNFPKVALLSSCETGLGNFQMGSGIFSIANALKRGGTKHIIKTLWPIDDKKSKEFMIKLYEYWAGGASLQESIQSAKNDFKLQGEHPSMWAGFILEGNGNVYLE